jgi:hypothetical protein
MRSIGYGEARPDGKLRAEAIQGYTHAAGLIESVAIAAPYSQVAKAMPQPVPASERQDGT